VTKKARIGIIGAGYWAAYFYLPYIAASPDATCVGVVRRNEAARTALKSTFEMEVATGDVDVLLDAGCDAVIVASPHGRHLEHVERALGAGCDVLVEKPMTLTIDDALSLAAAAKRSDQLVTVANGWNYSNIATWAMDLVESGELGEVRAISGSMASALVSLYAGETGYGTMNLAGHEFEASRETYADVDAGGGYLYGQLSHQLGLALSLLRSNPQEVSATMSRLPNGTDIDDSVNVRFDDGATGSFFGSGRLPWGLRYPLTVQAFADGGIINLDFGRDTAEAFFSRADDRETYPLRDGVQAFVGRPPDLVLSTSPGDGIYNCDGPIQHLIDHCVGRPTIERASVDLGVRTVAVLDAASRSAQLQEPIAVSGL
jgi:predicted dehydrogenase